MRAAVSSRYQGTLARFCYQLGKIYCLKRRADSGECVQESDVAPLMADLTRMKEEFLAAKAEAGYTDGLEFLEDNSFAGFRMEKGELKGDISRMSDIVRPWMNEYPGGDNYRYEVANLLLGYRVAMQDEEEQQRQRATVQPKKDAKEKRTLQRKRATRGRRKASGKRRLPLSDLLDIFVL